MYTAVGVTSPSTSPETFSAVPASINVQFSWSPPSHLNSSTVIASYTLICMGDMMMNNLIMTYTEAGSYSLAGFRPSTAYNCSVHASNMAGDGPPSTIGITTMDDG